MPIVGDIRGAKIISTHFSKILFILLFFSSFVFSQLNVDSLWKAYNISSSQEKKIDIIHQLSNFYLATSKFDSSLTLIEKVIMFAELKGIDSLKAQAYSNMITIYTEKDQHEIALGYSNKALEYAIKINDKLLQSTILGNTSIIFGKEGKFKQEIEYTKRSLSIAEELDSKLDMAISNGNLATAYYAQGYHETAINYTLKSMQISQEIKDSIGIGFMSMQMGDNYAAIRKFDEAITYYETAIKIFADENAPLEMANAEVSYGAILTEKKDYFNAQKAFNNALKSYKKLNLNNGVAYATRSIAELLLKQKKFHEANKTAVLALEYYNGTDLKPDLIQMNLLLAEIQLKLGDLKKVKSSLDNSEFLLKKINTQSLRERLYKLKSDYYEHIGSFKLAYKNQKLHAEIKDSLQNNKNTAKATDLQIKYDVESKQKENELLITQNKLQKLKAEESKIFRNFSILIIVLLIILGIILVTRYRTEVLLNNKLEDANATKDKFFSIISHDLKNPFSTLLGYSEMLIMDFNKFNDAEKKEYIESIQKSAKYTYNLLENLLDWSKSQRGEIRINPTTINVSELVNNTLNLVSQAAKKKNIELTNQLESDFFIYADEDTISSVFRNLLTNAIKFTNQGGIISVYGSRDNESVKLTVEDNGIGIEQDKLALLFKIDAHQSTVGTSKEKGTGLGLILCKEFMKQNNGDIYVESAVGAGSKFTITLPS